MKDHSYTSFNDMKGLSQNCIHGLASIDNHLWIGTHANGIDLMDIRTEKIIKHYTISVILMQTKTTSSYTFINSKTMICW